MATASPSADESVFDNMTEQIMAVFDRLLREVEARRDQLLSEVSKRRREFELKNSGMIENVRELEEMRSQLEKMAVKQNLAMKRQQESLAGINSEIDKLRTDVCKNTQLKYSGSIDQLIQQVKQFGEIINQASIQAIYSKKLTAFKIMNEFLYQKFDSSIRLYVDYHKELFYVTCSSSKMALVYNANNFQYKLKFGDSSYQPYLLASSKEFVYVGATNNKLFQYKATDLSFIRSIQSLNKSEYPYMESISVNIENKVFVLDQTGLLRIYDRALNLKKKIKLELDRFGELTRHSSLSMVIRGEQFYILFSKVILFGSITDWNDINYYFKKKEGRIPFVKNPCAFYIDQTGNVIVADSATNSLKFLSPEGGLKHTIGENTVGSDYIPGCSDIAVYKDNIIVACRNPKLNESQIRVY